VNHDRSRVLERLRRLRALSTSSNEHEAAAAAAAAERLLQEHEIAEAEIEGAGSVPVEGARREALGRVPAQLWIATLGHNLAQLHSCAVWRTGAVPNGFFLHIVGRPDDVATVRYLFAWLLSEITRLAESLGAGRGLRWRNAFRHGATSGVLAAMRDARHEARRVASSTALAVLDDRLAEARKLLPPLKQGRAPRIGDGDAFRRGREEGAKLHTGRALGPGLPALPRGAGG
jgi:hypothetical protein